MMNADWEVVAQDEQFHVIYTNEKVKREEWRTFPVGETRFNDDALRRAGEFMRSTSLSRSGWLTLCR